MSVQQLLDQSSKKDLKQVLMERKKKQPKTMNEIHTYTVNVYFYIHAAQLLIKAVFLTSHIEITSLKNTYRFLVWLIIQLAKRNVEVRLL